MKNNKFNISEINLCIYVLSLLKIGIVVKSIIPKALSIWFSRISMFYID